ncbi:MAG: arginine repressor [Lachnospiraceae bacterium]|jgi:transcriptional regulator of arginine metabolism|nr:arginine repressor [Lachnospiraceae bacterium]
MKTKRQKLICDLIDQFEIETQEELVAKLQEAGCSVTQATVSRDIRQLRLTKIVGESGVQKYALPVQETAEQPPMAALRFSRVLQQGFVSAEVAGSLVVVRTMTGMAMAVAAALDSLKLEEIVGTIAGDDTIFLAVHSEESGRILKNKILALVE